MSAALCAFGADHSVNKNDYKLSNKNLEKVALSRGLLEAEESLDVHLVHLGYGSEVVEVTLLLLGLLGEDVAVVSVFSLDFS
jgi:hypothetical protein